MASVQQVSPIARGFAKAYQFDVSSDDEPFPAGCSLRASVADYAGGPIAGVLSTDDQTIVRVDSHNIILNLSADLTGRLGNSTALIDLVRDDELPQQWLGIQVTLPVATPVTTP